MLKSCLWAASAVPVLVLLAAVARGEVEILRTPEGGIQPQAAVDDRGVLHLIYFKGAANGGDLFYTRRSAETALFTAPLRVNSQPGSAMAIGSIRGAHLALGKDNRVHVAWMGSDKAKRASVRGEPATPMVYTRLNDEATAFEPERNVLTWAAGLDGGGSVAADLQGNVYITWHASPPNNEDEEAGRAVFVACSHDDGKTFAREIQANPTRTGACGCCGMRAFADSKGNLFMLYRAATDRSERGMRLLVSGPKPLAFRVEQPSHWRLGICPMSSAALTEGGGAVLAAWETQDQVQFSVLTPPTLQLSPPITPPGKGKRKHPSVARNGKGETLLAWTENTGWEKGGSLAWQLFDAKGLPMDVAGQRDGVPIWSLVSAVANPNGDFVVVY
jgi:hypothetical protein